MFDIDTLLDEVVTLPSMPDSLARITQLINDPDGSMAEVGKAISADPSIALKTLRLVNSVYYGLDQKVSTVEHAVVLLGAKVVKNMVLSATVFDTIRGGADVFMRHSAACGVAMRTLAGVGHLDAYFDDSEEAFLYGLLHDIGKVIFQQYLPQEYGEVGEKAAEEGLPWFEAERAIIGVDHAELGACLAAKWKLSAQIVNAIAGHHDTERAEDSFRPLAANLMIADYICTVCGFVSHEGAVVTVPEAAWGQSMLTGSAAMRVMDTFFGALPDVEELVQISAQT